MPYLERRAVSYIRHAVDTIDYPPTKENSFQYPKADVNLSMLLIMILETTTCMKKKKNTDRE